MKSIPRKSWIRVLRDAFDLWRIREGLNEQSVADRVAEVHHGRGFAAETGVSFHPVSGSADRAARALRTNAQKLFRWLDDESKDTNLLTVNLLRSTLAALPMDLRLRAAGRMLAEVDLAVSPLTPAEPASRVALLADLARESGEGIAAFAGLCEPSALAQADLDALIAVDSELAEAQAALAKSRDAVAARLTELFRSRRAQG